MPSAGELLRSERLKRNRTLADIAGQTRISRRYLEAIETDSTNDLPGEFFYQAFIRQYAVALGLNEAETARIVSSAIPLNEPDPLPVLSQIYERAQTSSDSARWKPPTPVAVGLLLAVIAGGSLLYAWWQRATTAETAASQQAPAAVPAAKETPAESRPVEPVAAQPAPPPQTEAAPTPQTSAEPVAPATTQPGLEIAASEPSWIQVSSEGKTVFIGTLEANQPRQFATGASATLRTGNAGAIEVRWNGKSVGSIGPKGQVRVVRLTPEGAQVVAPQPKTVAPETVSPGF